MNYLLAFNFSRKIRFLFLSFTLIFLLIFLLNTDDVVFLIFFVNLAYIYLAYFNKPLLIVTESELIQQSFLSKRIKIVDLKNVMINNSLIVFSTDEDTLVVKLKYIDSSDKVSLIEFVREQRLMTY